MIKPGNRDPFRTSGDQSWWACTAEGARQDVHNLFARMSFRERVAWLEEAEAISERFRVIKRDRRAKTENGHLADLPGSPELPSEGG